MKKIMLSILGLLFAIQFSSEAKAACIKIHSADVCTGQRVFMKKKLSKTGGTITGFDYDNNQILVNTDAFGEYGFYVSDIAFSQLKTRGVGNGDVVKIEYNGIRKAKVLGVYTNGEVFVNLDGYGYMVFSGSQMMSAD